MKKTLCGICFLLIVTLLAAMGCVSALAENVLRLPSGLETVEEEAFYGVQADKVVLPSGVKEIGSGAFAASSVKSINFPDGIEHIADDAFTGSALEKVTAREGTYGCQWAKDHGYNVSYEIPTLTWVQGMSTPRDNDMV